YSASMRANSTPYPGLVASTEISTSQCIAVPFAVGQQGVNGGAVAARQRLAELRQFPLEGRQRLQDGGAVLQQDGGPQGRVAGGVMTTRRPARRWASAWSGPRFSLPASG